MIMSSPTTKFLGDFVLRLGNISGSAAAVSFKFFPRLMPAFRPQLPARYGLGRLVTTIGPSVLKPNRFTDLGQYSPRVLSSATVHLNRPTFTIEVPGSPPIWTPQPLPYRLEPDKKMVEELLNIKIPTYPIRPGYMEQVLRPMVYTAPDFPMRELDIVTNASNLTKLYQFCLHPSAMGQRHNWRLHCELHGERTMLLHLWNRNDYRVPNIMGNSGTYGRMFEVHNTHEPNGAHPMLSGHFRTVGYRLAGMNFAVRRQIDALLPDWNGPAVFPNAKRISKPKVTRHEDFTMIYTGGQPVTGRTIELKTSQSSIPDYRIHEEWIDHIATCWFSRVPLIMCGRYNDEGNFIRVDSFDLDKGGVVKAWINESRRPLERMMHLLKLMRETIRQSKKGRLAFVRNDEPFVAVHELDQGNVSLLPDDVSKMLQ